MNKNLFRLGVASLMAVSLAGCGKSGELSKAELQEVNTNLSAQVVTQNNTIKQLKEIIANYNPNDSNVQGIDEYFALASSEGAYLEFDGKINIDNPITVSPSRAIQNETLLRLTNDISFSPNQNWIVRASSGHMELSHSSGVYGEVDCYEYLDKAYTSSVYEDYIEPHFKAIRGELVGTPTNIFLASGEHAGKQATARLKVAKLKDGTLHLQEEEMTEPYNEATLADINQTQIVEETVSDAESSSEEVSTDVSVENTSEVVDESATAESSAETEVHEGDVAPENLAAGELTGEVITQDEADTLEVDDYLYTVALAMYSGNDGVTNVVVFKFFYPESTNPAENSTKAEFVGSTIKSFSINGNPLTLQ